MFKSGLALLGLVCVAASQAQVFDHLGGTNQRQGRNPAATAADNPGLMKLRWGDPTLAAKRVLDNWDTAPLGTKPFTNFIAANWGDPLDAKGASYVDLSNGTEAPYRYAFATASALTNDYWTPANPALLKVFTWNFPQYQNGDELELFVNIPVGPTDINNAVLTEDLRFQARYQVYQIEGVDNPDGTTDPIYVKIDTFNVLGGTVRLGLDRGPNATWTANLNGGVKITLLNTIPRNSSGTLEDPEENNPAGTIGKLVYADSAEAQLVLPGNAGTITAQPVVYQRTSGNPTDYTVAAGRNEAVSGQVGSEVFSSNMAIVTGYAHNGQKITAAEPGLGGSVRRNILWSWPVRRPFANSSAELNTFNTAKSTWMETNGRYQQVLTQDNQSSGVTPTGGWNVATLPNNKGDDALTFPAVVGAATQQISFAKNGLNGQYVIQVWSPGGTFANRVIVQVKSLGFTIASGEVDLNGATGWRAVRAAGFSNFEAFGNLELVITNETNDAGSAGADVVADQVRFIRTADLSMTSTPVAVQMPINVGGSLVNRTVLFVALQNGRIYALDGDGDPLTGTTEVFWAYPSERAVDPNHIATEDGVDGIAEMPAQFDLTSAAFETVTYGPGDQRTVLVIGSTNGKVYCLDAQGRGDQTPTLYGTTRRYWSWPDDYPAAPSTENHGAIVGSVSWSNMGGVQKWIVPTSSGRVFALNAVGNDTTKTTSVAWQYPAPAATPRGPVVMSALSHLNHIVFGSGDAMISLDAASGAENWVKTNGATGAFLPFGTSTPALMRQISDPLLPHDTLFFGNGDGYIYAVDLANGNTDWAENSIGAVASAPLTAMHRRGFLTTGALSPTPEPIVLVPTNANSYVALRAVNSITGNRGSVAWTGRLKGSPTPAATGARAIGANPNLIDARMDDEFGYMFGADSDGNLLAYGYDPDFGLDDQWLPDGAPPVDDGIDDNDPNSVDVSNIAKGAKVAFILENDLYMLTRLSREGTLKQSDVDAAVTNGAAITRRHFEFGERLNFIAYDMPDPATLGSGASYSVEIQISTPGGSSQRRSEFPRIITDAASPLRSRFITGQIAIVGTGNNAVAPGPTTVKCSIVGYASSSGGQAQSTSEIPKANISFGGQITTNNPMGIRMLSTQAGNVNLAISGTPLEAFADGNGNQDLDNNTGAVIANQVLRQGFAPSLAEATGVAPEVAHGNQAQSRIFLYDRSCMSTLLGLDRGLPNIRMANRDLLIQGANGSIPAKALGTDYPLFEQPISRPNGVNISLDYPDMKRSLIEVVKEVSGNAENPLFSPVSLNPPAYTVADYQQYKSDGATYNAGLPRTTQATPFDYRLNTPRFQPPSNYLGTQYAYVDAQRTTLSFVPGATTGYAYREFTANAVVGGDERLSVVQETIDLGTLMGGAGFAPGVPFAAPGINFQAPVFNPSGNPFFQRFGVMNEGNVNLLNVRVAKAVENDFELSKISGLGLQPSAWLNISRHLHSDIDPEYAPAGTSNRVAIQKARPGDLEPTRLRVNPIRRANPAIGATQVPLLNTAVFPANEDPKIAVSIPIGAPMGNYTVNVVVFEDRDVVNAFNSPVLNLEASSTYEPYADPFVLKLNVGETRLTNARPNKAINMIDTDLGLTGKESHRWGNLQPNMYRDGLGHVYMAFASERRGGTNVADWNARLKTPADTTTPQYRIYIASLAGGVPFAPGVDPSPLSDLDRFSPAIASRWFFQELNPFPIFASPETLFGVGAGETVQPGSVQFGSPTFPTSGGFASRISPGNTGRNSTIAPYMAFIAEFNKVDGTGQVTRESRIFLSRLSGGPGSVTMSAPVMLSTTAAVIDPSAKIGRPSLIQDENGVATLFFTVTRGGQSQLMFATYNGTNWVVRPGFGGNAVVQSFNFGSAFELISNASSYLRPAGGLDIVMTGRVRGRSGSEVFLGRMSPTNSAQPSFSGGGWMNKWNTLVSPLNKDARTGIYWGLGVQLDTRDWNQDSAGTLADPTVADFIDVFRRTNAGYVSVIKPGTRKLSERTNNVVAECMLGGTITINMTSGAVQFDGALIPANMQLSMRYRAEFVRISGGQGANYKGVSMVFDDRMVGDTLNWRDAGGNPLGTVVPRNDRFVFTYLKEDQESRLGPQAIMRTARFGIVLSQRLATDANGNYQITAISGNLGPFQVDPVNNRIYFQSEDEARSVQISYVSTGGNTTDRQTVGVLTETAETTLPMTPGVTSLQVALDAPSTAFNNNVSARRANLLWLIWSSTQQGVPDIYMGTVAPFFSSRP